MTPKDWFQTLAGQSVASFVVGLVVALLTLWYASTLPCDGQSLPSVDTVYALQNCGFFHYTEPTILGVPANLAWLPFGAVAGAITFVIEKGFFSK